MLCSEEEECVAGDADQRWSRLSPLSAKYLVAYVLSAFRIYISRNKSFDFRSTGAWCMYSENSACALHELWRWAIHDHKKATFGSHHHMEGVKSTSRAEPLISSDIATTVSHSNKVRIWWYTFIERWRKRHNVCKEKTKAKKISSLQFLFIEHFERFLSTNVCNRVCTAYAFPADDDDDDNIFGKKCWKVGDEASGAGLQTAT